MDSLKKLERDRKRKSTKKIEWKVQFRPHKQQDLRPIKKKGTRPIIVTRQHNNNTKKDVMSLWKKFWLHSLFREDNLVFHMIVYYTWRRRSHSFSISWWIIMTNWKQLRHLVVTNQIDEHNTSRQEWQPFNWMISNFSVFLERWFLKKYLKKQFESLKYNVEWSPQKCSLNTLIWIITQLKLFLRNQLHIHSSKCIIFF